MVLQQIFCRFTGSAAQTHCARLPPRSFWRKKFSWAGVWSPNSQKFLPHKNFPLYCICCNLVFLSFRVVLSCSRVLFSCKFFTSSLSSMRGTIPPPLFSLPFTPLFHCLCSMLVSVSLVSAPSPASCSCAGLRALLKLLSLSMLNKTCSLRLKVKL